MLDFNFRSCNKEFWHLSPVYLSGYMHPKGPSIFNLGSSVFFNWDSLVMDRDSWFFTIWVPGLTITICNKIAVITLNYYYQHCPTLPFNLFLSRTHPQLIVQWEAYFTHHEKNKVRLQVYFCTGYRHESLIYKRCSLWPLICRLNVATAI